MRAWAAQLRTTLVSRRYIASAHATAVGLRRRWPRAGSEIAALAPSASSSSFSVGRAECCSRRHSSMGTRTATSTPRRGNELWPFAQARIQQFAKARPGVLDRPDLHGWLAPYMTSHIPSLIPATVQIPFRIAARALPTLRSSRWGTPSHM